MDSALSIANDDATTLVLTKALHKPFLFNSGDTTMTTFEIRDLAADKELDREAMAEIRGGMYGDLFGGIDILSPDFLNMVTPINQAASIPTIQTNNLAQVDTTVATNGYGINYVSNNKFAAQSNSNSVSDFMNPSVGYPYLVY
ncbi:MAG: hypothetical protein L0Y39_08895 [Methylococcaceae bacterium]|nr:hypothetical protein [Methylococcaceae bacterium]